MFKYSLYCLLFHIVNSVNYQTFDLLEWSKENSYYFNENNKIFYGDDSYKNKSEYVSSLQSTIFNGFFPNIIF